MKKPSLMRASVHPLGDSVLNASLLVAFAVGLVIAIIADAAPLVVSVACFSASVCGT
jgi:hypothetical protein